MKKLSFVFIILYIALLAAPAVAIPFFAGQTTAENRELATFPKFREDGAWNMDYTSDLDAWIGDHIGFRQQLVSAGSKWQAELFGHSSEDSIIVGSDGWLYYAETAYDYLNIATLSKRNANNIGRTLQMMQEYVESQGAAFTVALIPNKNTVYGENMPYYYIPLDSDGNLELVTAAMQKYGVTYSDMEQAIAASKQELYQAQDSHWTYEGALLGYRAILSSLGAEHLTFEGLEFEERTDWAADLAGMLYGDGAKPAPQKYPRLDFTYDIVSRETKVDAITLLTEREGGNGNLVMFRDSFCNTMQVFFAENAAQAVFSRAYPYPLYYVERYNADQCVIEIVERNIPNLGAKAPILPAPVAELSVSAKGMKKDAVDAFARDYSGYLHVFGTLEEQYLGDEYEVYVLCNDGARTTAYEAFPVYERELLGAEELGDNGFSVYLPDDACTMEMKYSVVVFSSGVYYAAQDIPVAEYEK